MTPKNQQAKRRHHYVWANYLSRWANQKGEVHYSTAKGNIACDSIRGIVVEDYFYKLTRLTPQHVEIIKSFSAQSPKHLHEQHMSYLNDFVIMQQLEKLYRSSGKTDEEVEKKLHAAKCNMIENLHASHERSALPILNALADENLDILQDNSQMIEFTMFLGHQVSRTKTFRDGVACAQPRSNEQEILIADTMAHAWWFFS
ncbi:DUF4238 domain-containing protein [Pseudomonas sp. B21-009]|uniref:DUF4238 domain-containing protein n=1 Tax=Pseudomonas sp. B21-009 TaxID=2895470 RepID=UPI00215EF043|nr:DUF4238 domain-containing protein [Pseudomonas sp. B21-009]UVM64584.1 DUF4238 domain-containing protein [Pseudomonas sp. B21-009]